MDDVRAKLSIFGENRAEHMHCIQDQLDRNRKHDGFEVVFDYPDIFESWASLGSRGSVGQCDKS